MKLVLSKNRAIDFRVSTLPTLHGEKIVLRILDPSSATLGSKPSATSRTRRRCWMRSTAPTAWSSSPARPVGQNGVALHLPSTSQTSRESTFPPPRSGRNSAPGVNQVNVDDRAGLTFSAALKSFLRQDPDIIMVAKSAT